MKKLLLLFCYLTLAVSADTQCPFDNTLYIDATPACPGTSTALCMNGGQYVTVSVVAGNTYTFSTCGNAAFDTEITVYDAGGVTVLGYNDDDCGLQSTVTWVATFTGTVNVLVDEFSCNNTGVCTDLVVTCALPVQTANGCNTNITICTPGQAGPFGFSTPGPAVGSCLDWIGLSYAYIVLYITQSGPLEMLINGDATTGFLDVAIFNIPFGVDPCVAIQDVNNEISCNYASTAGGCNEIGTFFGCSSQVPSPMVTAGDVLMIVIENWSNVSTNFTLDLGPPPAAQTGPPDATIVPVASVCSTDAPFQLIAANSGGDWTGVGVSPTGMFDPSVGAGTYTIDYGIGSVPCSDADQTTITVVDCSVPIPCPDYSTVVTGLFDACGGQLYDFNVANTGCNGIINFNVVGNYGSTFANENTWVVTSVLTGNVVASGGPGTNGAGFNVNVNLDPNIEGNLYEFVVTDSWGDGYNGTGGFFQIEDQLGNVIGGPVTGNFGGSSTALFVVNIEISTSTLTINTPSGNIVSTIGNCADYNVQFALDNTNFCTPIMVNLPWSIVCDTTGVVISSGVHPVTVYPQIASASTDVVDISWNTGTCQWDVVAQNDCDLLDIGTIFNISPDPFAWPANTCVGGTQDFTVDYIGVIGGPDCCSTGGALGPITYDVTTTVADPIAVDSPYGGINNSGNTTIPANTVGGNATSFDLTVTGTGYCYPNPAGASLDDDWYVAIWVDGVQILLQGPMTGTNFNITIDETDLAAAGITYNQNSVIEVYVLPNLFWEGTPPIYTTYVPGVSCGTLGDGEWTLGTYDVTTNVVFTEQVASPANCSFLTSPPYTCCVITMPTGSNPPNINVECSGGAPAADPLVVTDEASPCNPVVTHQSDASDGLNCPETITRTYRITDDCGNFTDVQQLIIIGDVTPPVFVTPPAAISVQCGAIPPMVNLAWTDNCDGAGSVAGSDGPLIGGNCGGTITRTWTYADGCGNTDIETQTITVHDTQAPVMAAAPADLAVQCIGDVPAIIDLAYTDNCDAPGVVTGADLSDGLTCPETITRTWTFMDVCGNSAMTTQTITVQDTQVPVFVAPLADLAVECVGDFPAMTDIGWTDNCDGAGTVTGVDEALTDPCGGTVTRTWTFTDACGNNATITQTITVDDTTPPTASNPVTTTAPGGPIPAVDITVVIDEADNCTVNPVVAFVSETSDNNPCPETITRIYSVTDDCGNTINVTHLIIITDPILPTGTPPAAVNVECIGDVPVADPLLIVDEADNQGIPVVAFVSDVSDGLTCPETITRTYSITDLCANIVLVTQLITVMDITNPTGVAPANVNVECIGDVPVSNVLDITTEADNCTASPTIAWIGDVSDGLSCPETITRTYSITDDCGNQITVDQSIIVNDVTPPTASNPAPISVPGSNDVPVPNPLVVIDELDNCTVNPVVVWVSDVSDGNVCNLEKITRTYSVTDNCGNQISVTHEITILAIPAPIDAGPDQAICEGDLVTITVGNPLSVSIVWDPVVPAGPFAPVVTTTYVVTAYNEGCISTDSITITVEPAPVVSFIGDVLSGCEPLSVIFENTSTSASGFTNCVWTINGETLNGCGNVTYTFLNSGTYDVTLTTTSGTGCVSSVTYTDYIYIEETPLASFVPSSNQLTTIDTEVQFDNTSVGADNYAWTFGNDLSSTTVENPIYEFPTDEGSYQVELIAYSPLGCSDTAWMTIAVVKELIFYVPNSFTPDGDSYNEYFQAIFTSGYDPYDFELLIFNRWGEIIWESHDDSIGWDGTYGAGQKLVQDGVYTWRIEFKTTQTDERILVVGHVNVLR